MVPGAREVRRFVRVPFFAKATLAVLFEAQVIEARSIDISLGGVSLACPTPLPIGQLVSLTFHLTTGETRSEERPVSGRVSHLRFDDDAAIIGVEFTPTLDRMVMPALVRAIERL
jgi:hypothetical protein